MSKPMIKKITPFDGNRDYEITISWSGNLSYSNRVIIYDSETNDVVYDQTIKTFSLTHTIPAYTLSNGKLWTIQAQTFDVEETASPLSDKVSFYTFETPEFYFDNLPHDKRITAASFSASVHYYSSDWENISTYIFYLYDSTKKLLLESSPYHDDADINYTFRGLENDTGYYIRCVGTTVNGMELDTGYVSIHVRFENQNTYARLYATDIPRQGCIQISTNLVIIQYNGTQSFDYSDGMIDLIGKILYYDEGFTIPDDFTLILRGTNLWRNGTILQMKNKKQELTLSAHIYGEEKLRFRLCVPNGIGTYLLYSDEQVFENEDMITIALRRKNNIYQMKVFTESNYSTEGNIWYGSTRPDNGLEDYDIWIETSGTTYRTDKDLVTTNPDSQEPDVIKLDDLWIGGA